MDAAVFKAWIVSAAAAIEANRDHLTRLDAAIGDADHGINLSRGFTAVLGALDPASKTPGAILTLTGNALISKVGGASGPLYGVAFRRAGKSLGDAADVDLPAVAAALQAALAGVQQLGAADLGDQGVARHGQDRPGRGHLRAPSVQRAEDGGEATGQVDAVVGVADRRVQLGEVIAVGLDNPGGRHDPGPEDLSVHDGSLTDGGNHCP